MSWEKLTATKRSLECVGGKLALFGNCKKHIRRLKNRDETLGNSASSWKRASN